MKKAVSCGGVVIFRGKVLLLFINYYNKYEGWVLPKGAAEEGETFEEAALREVKEETGASGFVVDYLGACEYEFRAHGDLINKTVYWFLISGESFYNRPQREEHFTDSGFYKFHEAYYLLKYDNERDMLEKAFEIYHRLKKEGKWVERRTEKN